MYDLMKGEEKLRKKSFKVQDLPPDFQVGGIIRKV
ncbi:MAG: hypothetical protein DDT21_02688 [Syntrophomonadaceae bacterium]|nr:hypothetical protein [Bacillota bacterium]